MQATDNAMVPAGPSSLQTGGSTADGIQLETGERVIHFHACSYTSQRVLLIIVGIIFAIIVIGIALIVVGVLLPRWKPRSVIVTNKRVAIVGFKGDVKSTALLTDIKYLEAKRDVQSHGGGLVGLAVSAAMTVAAESNQTTQPQYWKSCKGIICNLTNGKLVIDVENPTELGPCLARAIAPGGADQLPTVQAPA
jgi:hypothetical protein